jgi:hypothetical protein
MMANWTGIQECEFWARDKLSWGLTSMAHGFALENGENWESQEQVGLYLQNCGAVTVAGHNLQISPSLLTNPPSFTVINWGNLMYWKGKRLKWLLLNNHLYHPSQKNKTVI